MEVEKHAVIKSAANCNWLGSSCLSAALHYMYQQTKPPPLWNCLVHCDKERTGKSVNCITSQTQNFWMGLAS